MAYNLPLNSLFPELYIDISLFSFFLPSFLNIFFEVLLFVNLSADKWTLVQQSVGRIRLSIG